MGIKEIFSKINSLPLLLRIFVYLIILGVVVFVLVNIFIVLTIANLVIMAGAPDGEYPNQDSCSNSANFTVVSASNSDGNLYLIVTNKAVTHLSDVSMVTDNNIYGTGIYSLWFAGTTDEIVFEDAIRTPDKYSITITIKYYLGKTTETIVCTGNVG